MAEMKFRIGEQVKIVEHRLAACRKYTVGKTGIIVQITKDTTPYKVSIESITWWFRECDLEPYPDPRDTEIARLRTVLDRIRNSAMKRNWVTGRTDNDLADVIETALESNETQRAFRECGEREIARLHVEIVKLKTGIKHMVTLIDDITSRVCNLPAKLLLESERLRTLSVSPDEEKSKLHSEVSDVTMTAPLPERLSNRYQGGRFLVPDGDEDGGSIGWTKSGEIAAEIARRWNAHEALVAVEKAAQTLDAAERVARVASETFMAKRRASLTPLSECVDWPEFHAVRKTREEANEALSALRAALAAAKEGA